MANETTDRPTVGMPSGVRGENAQLVRARLRILADQTGAPDYQWNAVGSLYVRRIPTDTPLYAVSTVVTESGGMSDLYTGTMGEILAYVSGRLNW